MGGTSVRAGGPLSGSSRDGSGLRCARADRSRGHRAMGRTSVRASGPLSGSSRDGSDFGARERTALGVIARWVGLRFVTGLAARARQRPGAKRRPRGRPVAGPETHSSAEARQDGQDASGGESFRTSGPPTDRMRWAGGRVGRAVRRDGQNALGGRLGRAVRRDGQDALGGESPRTSGPSRRRLSGPSMGKRLIQGMRAQMSPRPATEMQRGSMPAQSLASVHSSEQ